MSHPAHQKYFLAGPIHSRLSFGTSGATENWWSLIRRIFTSAFSRSTLGADRGKARQGETTWIWLSQSKVTSICKLRNCDFCLYLGWLIVPLSMINTLATATQRLNLVTAVSNRLQDAPRFDRSFFTQSHLIQSDLHQAAQLGMHFWFHA